MATRVTQAQARMLFGTKPAGERAPRVQKRREDLGENQVEAQVLDYLRLKGWEVRRNQVGTFVPYYAAMECARGQPLNHRSVVRIGEKGEPDYFVFRGHECGCRALGMAAFWLELKARGRKPSPEQIAWIAKRKALGYCAVWFDSLEDFRAWYRNEWE